MKKLLLLFVLLGAVLMIVVPSMAIAPPYSGSIVSMTDYSNDCGLTSRYEYGYTAMVGLDVDVQITATGTETNWLPDTDTYRIVIRDADGNRIVDSLGATIDGQQVTNTFTVPVHMNNFALFMPSDEPTSRPWSLFIQEIRYSNSDLYEPETLLLTFDPADYNPACLRLPYIGVQEPDPINDVSSANEVSIYESTDESGAPSLNLYDVDEDGNGTYALTITQDDIAPFDGNPPSENTEILTSDDGNIRVFVLDTGEIQVNSGPDEEGKIHVVIMDGIPPTSTYGYTIDPPSAE